MSAPVDAAEFITKSPEKGVYQINGSDTVDAAPEALLTLLIDYPQQCQKGCRYSVPSVSSAEIIAGSSPEHFFTFTRIDDVLDASYFSEIKIERQAGRIVLRYGTPEKVDIERLASPQQPHEPFFFFLQGSWTLESLPLDSSGRPRTAVKMEMAMRSDRFLVNLLPQRVLDGAQRHLEMLLGHMKMLK